MKVRHVLTGDKVFKLFEYLRTLPHPTHASMPQLAEQASKALGFHLTESNIRSVIKSSGITHIRPRKNRRGAGKKDRIQRLATVVLELHKAIRQIMIHNDIDDLNDSENALLPKAVYDDLLALIQRRKESE